MLKSVLSKYMTYAQANDILDKHWKISYGVKFSEYLGILNLGGMPH